VSFAFLVALAVGLVAACGRQVTPDPPGLGAGGAPPGYLAVFFTVQAPFNFSNYQYMVVFNTTGNGITPSTDTIQTNWAGYMFALFAAGNGGITYAKFVQFVPSRNVHGAPGWYEPGTNPQQLSYNLDANGAQTEFSILAQRLIFTQLASPAPTASPSNAWTFNAFTLQQGASQGQWTFADSMGNGGPIDPQFVSPNLYMCEPFDRTFTAYYNQVPDQAAQIATVEIANNPSPLPSHCP
jgi:hypothetical protein